MGVTERKGKADVQEFSEEIYIEEWMDMSNKVSFWEKKQPAVSFKMESGSSENLNWILA